MEADIPPDYPDEDGFHAWYPLDRERILLGNFLLLNLLFLRLAAAEDEELEVPYKRGSKENSDHHPCGGRRKGKSEE